MTSWWALFTQKWLNAGVLEEGKRIRVEEGTPQGGSASPLLANVCGVSSTTGCHCLPSVILILSAAWASLPKARAGLR